MRASRRKCESGNPPDAQFLHNLWVRSKDYRDHQALCAKAEREGKPRPRIPDAIRAKYIVTKANLEAPVPETYNKLAPKEDKDGNVITDSRGNVVFRKVKAPISRRGVCQGIKDLYDPNCYTGGLQPA